ncbi:hypothetical protein GH714_000401 [Hevea brasiliensis]|uniref:Legume lectin domain-containing protein n=1 Tax=Hevea brasiliensis TaxID=3981 RepID=A0A6A6N9Q5_HEVBR|nr:hypothetical protein GH714_000401 [Hevea brasiliensis]
MLTSRRISLSPLTHRTMLHMLMGSHSSLFPPQYRMPDERQGSVIGLASGKLILNSTANPFVAVEFDTYYNPWDDMDHVGVSGIGLASGNMTIISTANPFVTVTQPILERKKWVTSLRRPRRMNDCRSS